MSNQRSSSGRDYALGAALIILGAASLYFLTGATAVFIAVFAAVAGAVFLLRGIQAPDRDDNPLSYSSGPGADPADGFDWDSAYRDTFNPESSENPENPENR